ncbi:MAG: hypothetical protein ACTSPV_03710 [Candidatus Hodarchaeales archaeon]
MQIDSNWAIFIEDKEVKWAFGNPDDEFLTFVTNFITGLSNIGEEVLGQHGIASIVFDLKQHSGFRTGEIFIISLMNKFFLIMTDPVVTMKLIDASGGITYEIQEIMSAVLVGQAAVLYAQCITDISPEEQKEVDKIWREIIVDISDKYRDNIDVILSEGGSNFSMMSFEDLIFLHYYLRKQSSFKQPLSPKGWALCSNMSGGEIPLTYHVDIRDPVILAGYLAIIISFLATLFESKPKSLLFGTNSISSLTFINGTEYFIAIDAPFTQLAKDDEFCKAFFGIEDKIIDDLRDSLKDQIIDEIIEKQMVYLRKMSIEDLLKSKFVKDIVREDLGKKSNQFKKIMRRIIGNL